LFAAQNSILTIARRLGVSYRTADHAATVVRDAILMDWPGGAAPSDQPDAIWGVAQRGKQVAVERGNELSLDRILNLDISLSVRTGVIYTDPWQPRTGPPYDTLVFRPRNPTIGRPGMRGKLIAIDHLKGFWQYVRTHQLLNRQIGSSRIGGYWQEQAFRFQHADEVLLPILVKKVCSLIPQPSNHRRSMNRCCI
jgi:transposase